MMLRHRDDDDGARVGEQLRFWSNQRSISDVSLGRRTRQGFRSNNEETEMVFPSYIYSAT